MWKLLVGVVLVVSLLLTSGVVQAAEQAKSKVGVRRRLLQVALKHAPNLVRHGAELYSLRLEMIHEFFTKKEYDRETGKLVSRMTERVEKLGLVAIDLVAALRAEAPHGHLRRMFKWEGRGAKRGKGVRKARRRWGRWVQRAKFRQRMIKRVRRVVRSLDLTEQQRFDLKLVALAWTPTLVRSGGKVLAQGIALGQEVLGHEFDKDKARAEVKKLAREVGSILENAMKLSFAMREKMTKQQVRRLLANMPLRLLFLR